MTGFFGSPLADLYPKAWQQFRGERGKIKKALLHWSKSFKVTDKERKALLEMGW